MRIFHRIVGVLAIGILGIGSLLGFNNLSKPPTGGFISVSDPDQANWVDYLLDQPTETTLSVSNPRLASHVRPGDPVFLIDEGDGKRVGVVKQVLPDEVVLQIDFSDTIPKSANYQFHVAGGRFDEAIRTLFPEEKRQLVQERLKRWASAHAEDSAAKLAPIIRKTIADSIPLIEKELRLAVKENQKEISSTVERLQVEVVDGRLVPLAKKELLPLLRLHAEPVAMEIGEELWDRASLWGFTWRAIYDKSPLPRRNLMEKEWERFVEEEAIPVIESHADEVAEVTQKIIVDAAANPTIRKELGEAAQQIIDDPATQQLVSDIVKRTIVENEALRQLWTDALSSPNAKSAFQEIGDTVEPVVRQIGDDIFGTRDEGISPGLARVLRAEILGRDRRWISVRAIRGGDLQLKYATKFEPFPELHLAAPEKDLASN